jgi:hypothetical protein
MVPGLGESPCPKVTYQYSVEAVLVPGLVIGTPLTYGELISLYAHLILFFGGIIMLIKGILHLLDTSDS